MEMTHVTKEAKEAGHVEYYDYRNEKGDILYQVVRTQPKGFFQRRQNPESPGWLNDMTGVRRVLYRLPELIATHINEPVFVVEGEKDADRLIREGLPATTNSGGAGKWRPEYNDYFRGRIVGIFPDNDEPGRMHARKIAESLCGIAYQIKIVTLPGLAPKGDVSDWLDAGNNPRQLTNMLLDSPDYVPDEKWTRRAEVVSLDEVEEEEIEWLWPNRIPLGMLTLFAGDPGTGKSFLSLYIASLVTKGQDAPDGGKIARGTVLLLGNEDHLTKTVLKRLNRLGTDVSRVKAIRKMRVREQNGEITSDHFSIAADRCELERLLNVYADTKLIIIDPINDYFGTIDTHKDANVRSVLSPLVEMAERCNVALVCVLHLNKSLVSKVVYRLQGSLAFPAAARTVWLISKDNDDPKGPRRLFLPAKHNVLDEPSGLAFTIKDGLFEFEKEPVVINADEAIKGGNETQTELEQAIDWLREILKTNGPMPAKDVFNAAKDENISIKTLKRAKKQLGVESKEEYNEEGEKHWCWYPPEDTYAKPVDLEELRKKALARANALLKSKKSSR